MVRVLSQETIAAHRLVNGVHVANMRADTEAHHAAHFAGLAMVIIP